jgi:hypothetical protein
MMTADMTKSPIKTMDDILEQNFTVVVPAFRAEIENVKRLFRDDPR